MEGLDLLDEQLDCPDQADVGETLIEFFNLDPVGPLAFPRLRVVVAYLHNAFLAYLSKEKTVLDVDSSQVRRTPGGRCLELADNVLSEILEAHCVDVQIMDIFVEVRKVPRGRRPRRLGLVDLACRPDQLVADELGVLGDAPGRVDGRPGFLRRACSQPGAGLDERR